MSKFFKRSEYILLAVGLVFVVVAGLYLYLNKSKDLPEKAVVSSIDTSQVKATLNRLDTKSVITNSKDKKEDPLTRKKTPQKPSSKSKDISKLTTADGAVELSVDKLNILPSIEAGGSITIHLDKDKERKHKSTEEEEIKSTTKQQSINKRSKDD